MQTVIQDAIQQQSTDIQIINNRIWFRIFGRLQQTQHSVQPFTGEISGFERKSETHLRRLPTDLTLSALRYPGEVSTPLDNEKGLIVFSGSHASGKTTLLLHWLSNLRNRSVYSQIALPTASLPNVLWSEDQPDIHILSVQNSDDAFAALRMSIHQLVIAVVDARSNTDALRHITMLLNQYNVQKIQSLLGEQIVSAVNIQLVRTAQQHFRPLVSITNRNESTSSIMTEGEFHKLEDAVQRGNGGAGSLSSDVQLADWLQQRQIDLDEALRFAIYPATMKLRAAGIIHND